MTDARAALTGVLAALRAPMWSSGSRLLAAMEPPAYDILMSFAEPAHSDEEIERAIVSAARALRVLAATRTVWRNSCLHQTLAQYLVMRSYRRRAAVRVGVRRPAGASPTGASIEAHAWLVRDGIESDDTTDGYSELAAPRG